jgi:DNA-binding response OmpR family regulator
MIKLQGDYSMSRMRILVVDDEVKILEVVKAYLEKADFEVLTAVDGQMAIDVFESEPLHLIVLDLMLPKISGKEVCRIIRAKSDIPIIMLTARVDEDDKIEGISIGADDYLTKPFSGRELVVRVKALIRRAYRDNKPLADYLVFNEGDLEVDVKKFEVKKKGELLNLTPNEIKILHVLISNPGQVFSREQLVEKAFGYDYEGFDRTVDTHIKNLRYKIEDNPKKPDYIVTVYSVGYKFGGKP